MQINGASHAGAINALDPQTSMNDAYTISNGGTDFSPWSTYTTTVPSLSYQQYLPQAQAAAVAGGSTEGNFANVGAGASNAPDYFDTNNLPGTQNNQLTLTPSAEPTDGGSYSPIGGMSYSEAPTTADATDTLASNTDLGIAQPGVTYQNNLDNYGYFGQQPISNSLSEVPGVTNSSTIDQSATNLLDGTQTGTADSTSNDYNYFGTSPGATLNPFSSTGGGTGILGAATSLANTATASTWWQTFMADAFEFLKRFGLVILGVVLIAAAAFAVTREGGIQETVKKVVA
jgi:hypothetical protein